MAYREAAGTLSYIVGPTLGGILYAFTDLSTVVMVSGLTSLVAAAWVLVFLRTPTAAETAERASKSLSDAAKKPSKKGESQDTRIPWLVVITMISIHFLYNFG